MSPLSFDGKLFDFELTHPSYIHIVNGLLLPRSSRSEHVNDRKTVEQGYIDLLVAFKPCHLSVLNVNSITFKGLSYL